MTKIEVLNRICEASFGGYLGLFVGAGFTKAALKGSPNYQAYSWKELLKECCKSMKIDPSIVELPLSNPEIASKICQKYLNNDQTKRIDYNKSINELKNIIAEKVTVFPTPKEKARYEKYFKEIDISWFVTTNYDTVIETFLEDRAVSLGPDDFFLKIKNKIPVYHIHGVRYSPQGIIITNEDYAKYFRPNDYRQARLPFLIKESVVLMVGYALGDLNVLTAVDLAKNVYKSNEETFPIIQLLYKEHGTRKEPYQEQSGIWVVEIESIPSFFDELLNEQEKVKKLKEKREIIVDKYNKIFQKPSSTNIENFIKKPVRRKRILRIISSLNREYSSIYLSFESFLRKTIAKCVQNEEPYGAFEAYDEHLKLILDLLSIPLNKMPVSFFAFLAQELENIAYYIGNDKGQSFSAFEMWKKEAKNISMDMVFQIRQYCAGKEPYYSHLREILDLEFIPK